MLAKCLPATSKVQESSPISYDFCRSIKSRFHVKLSPQVIKSSDTLVLALTQTNTELERKYPEPTSILFLRISVNQTHSLLRARPV